MGVHAQVYAVAAYVEGAKAQREFGVRQRGGFFEAGSGTGEYCDAVLDAACGKLLVLQLVRDVSGAQFVEVRPLVLSYAVKHLFVAELCSALRCTYQGPK